MRLIGFLYMIPLMEILSKETLRLLQDEKVRKTLLELLESAGLGESKTVKVEKDEKQEAAEVTVRRLSA